MMESPPDTPPAKHRRNNGNLRPAWPPGVSGNPAGRPRRKTFTELAYEYLGQPIDGKSGETRMERLVKAIVDRAIDGERCALTELLARIDPAPRHSVTVNNNLRAPIMDALDRMGIERAEQFGESAA